MARGRGKGRRGPPRGGRGGGGRGEEGEEEEEEEDYKPQRSQAPRGQSSTVGMLPPSGSEDEDEEEEGEGKKEPAAKKPAEEAAAGSSKPAQPKQRAPAGELPPNSDDEDEESEEEEESSDEDDQPVNDYLSAPRQRKPAQTEERDPETIRKDLERLALIRKKREDDRLQRIANEGWDRFAPISDTNRPPGSIPSDHPSLAGKN